jgi:hypothetical protein
MEIENRRQIQFGAAVADHELGRVADPALIRRRRGEVAVKQPTGPGSQLLALSAPGDFAPAQRVSEPSASYFSVLFLVHSE